MNNSDSITRSAPSARARSRAARTFAALPLTSPMVGLSWAKVIENWSARSVMNGSCLACAQTAIVRSDDTHASDNAHALGDRKQPEQPGGNQRHADRGRPHVLDPPDLQIVLGSQAIGELLDRRIEQFDDQHQGDRGDQFEPPHRGGPDYPGQRQRKEKRADLLAHGRLGADRKSEAVTRVDRGPPQPQQSSKPRYGRNR